MEEKRPGQYFDITETDKGTYILNANDLCMAEHLDKMRDAGIDSIKIEGRAKAAYYTAITTAAYRAAVDGYIASGYASDYKPEPWIVEELNKVSHRPYGTGFYFGMPHQDTTVGGYIRDYAVVGVVEGYENGNLLVEQRNRFFSADTLDVLEPGEKPFLFTVDTLYNGNGEPIESAPHAAMKLQIPYERPLKVGSLLRAKQ